MRSAGLEPARVLPHSDLNAARLPIPPRPLAIVNIEAHIERIIRTQGLCCKMKQVEDIFSTVEWKTSDQPVQYDEAVAWMEARVTQIFTGTASEVIWLLEHPALYTAGTSAKAKDLKDPNRFPVHQAQRGGQYTYHGPGQRVVYVLLDLNKRGRDIRKFVQDLENWVTQTLTEFNIVGETRSGRVGIWVQRPDKPLSPSGNIAEDKIAAVGVRLRKWISFHGISINVEPDLEHFSGIVPCGIAEHGITSLVDLGLPVSMIDLDLALKRTFKKCFDQ